MSDKKVSSIFDILKILITKSDDININDEEFYKSFQPYIVNRFLSMDKRFFYYSAILNRYTFEYNSNDKKSLFFHLANSLIPKNEINYIKYIKGEEKTKYPENIYKMMKMIHGEFLSVKEIDWIIEYMRNHNELKNELQKILLHCGLEYNELKKYFPDLYQDNIKKENNSSIRKEINKLLDAQKSKQQDSQINQVNQDNQQLDDII